MTQLPFVYRDQFQFQRSHAFGKVLNVGCNDDSVGFRHMGGINVDLFKVDPVTEKPNPIHAFADSRHLPFRHTFDAVVLGEILEHMEERDAVWTIFEAKYALRSGGRVVITMPHDGRRELGTQPEIEPGKEWYAPGIHAFHYRMISREELFGWIRKAGLRILAWGQIEYPWGVSGTGAIAC